MLLRLLTIIISVILTSCYYFPFAMRGGINPKMLMGGASLLILGIQLMRRRDTVIEKDFVILSLWGIGVSFASIAATTYNNTQDYSYLTYAVSMWVWMGGAYTLIKCIEWLNGEVSVEFVCNCIIATCAAQSVIAYLIYKYPLVENFACLIDPGLRTIQEYTEGRLYGIGCAFDPAGIRLSCGVVVLAFMVYRMLQKNEFHKWYVTFYFISFAVITIFGNMISRTTTIGIVLFILYLALCYTFNTSNNKANRRLLYSILSCLLISIPCVLYLYNSDSAFRSFFRFGFEGFFSLAEKGEWDVGSNDILWTMYRFPETLKTWIIGDGYMLSANNDPYYTGPFYLGYYKGTDVGYLRFIYYFGIIGLIPCIMQMITAAYIGVKRLPEYKMISILLLLVNFICWFKVSTDAFSVLAIFAVYGMMYSNKERELKA